MKKITLFVILIFLIGGLIVWYFINQPSVQKDIPELIKVENIQSNQEIQSPFIIKGEAVGSWFFEATFPVKLLDENGNVVKQTYAQAQGEWMTENFVSFESVLTFSIPKDQPGTLILQKDNPSGLPENDAEIRIPIILKAMEKQIDFSETGNLVKDNPGLKPGAWHLVYEEQGAPALYNELKFSLDSVCQIGSISESCNSVALEAGDRVEVVGWKIDNSVIVKNMLIQKTAEQMRKIKLYYYNPDLDKDDTGNVACSRKGLVAVDREIPLTITPIQDAIKLLVSGNLTNAEKLQGLTTEYPLAGFSLKSVSLNNGILTLTFEDINNKTSGGSCRAGILWFQIEATAKQFTEVKQVKFIPEELFQP